jgi:formylglycine-generating enzyme required for sulfatase activity
MHGNVYTWCQEMYRNYEIDKELEYMEYNENVLSIDSSKGRVARGGSFNSQASNLRCGSRTGVLPTFRNLYNGLRPARTFR